MLQVSSEEVATSLLVYARSVYDPNIMGYIKVDLTDQVKPSLKIKEDPDPVDLGSSKQFSVDITVPTGKDQGVVWKVEGAKSAQTNISGSGTLSVASDETAKVLTISATSNWDPKMRDELGVPVGTNFDIVKTISQENGNVADLITYALSQVKSQSSTPTYLKGSKQPLTFTSGTNYKDYQGVEIDGGEIDDSNYSLIQATGDYLLKNSTTDRTSPQAGNMVKSLDQYNYYTMVKLNASYLESLPVGAHTFNVVFGDGYAQEIAFNVMEVQLPNQVSIQRDVIPWVVIGLAILAIIAAGILTWKKQGKGAVVAADAADNANNAKTSDIINTSDVNQREEVQN
jgi:hypothetical protein